MANVHMGNGEIEWHGVKFPKYTSGIEFVRPGVAVYRPAGLINSIDIGKRTDERGVRYWAALEPIMVGLCPTDQAGGNGSFPPESTRPFGLENEPAVGGHEGVYILKAAHPRGLKILARQGIIPGDYVTGNINIGDGTCLACRRGAPALDCYNGPTFVGIGTMVEAEKWVKRETGRTQLPGAYVGSGGAVFVPISHVHKIPANMAETDRGLALGTQIDAVACAYSLWDAVGLETYVQGFRGVHELNILAIGSGRVALWGLDVLKERLGQLGARGNIFLCDTREGNLERVGDACGVPDENRYLVGRSRNPFSMRNLRSGFNYPSLGGDFRFDIAVDFAGPGALDQKRICELFDDVIAPQGIVATMAHGGYPGHELKMASGERLLKGHRLVIGLSPRNNMGRGADFLSRHANKFKPMMREIPGGLDERLAEQVASGGAAVKNEMEATVFYTRISSN
ncbi:hypothetical protein HYV84_07470 [Candidatus Woesearchaeota archaeon]|nr:hypothetical protein [Candidatus Woesearchaeota archaeon]